MRNMKEWTAMKWQMRLLWSLCVAWLMSDCVKSTSDGLSHKLAPRHLYTLFQGLSVFVCWFCSFFAFFQVPPRDEDINLLLEKVGMEKNPRIGISFGYPSNIIPLCVKRFFTRSNCCIKHKYLRSVIMNSAFWNISKPIFFWLLFKYETDIEMEKKLFIDNSKQLIVK